MKNLRRVILFLIFIAATINCSYGQTSADSLINILKEKNNKIQSFEVDAIIKIDVDFINIKDREVKISYLAPGKFSFDAKGLILLPKNGVQMEYMTLFNESHTAIDAGQEDVRGVKTRILKIIPESLESDIILAQLWLDPQNVRILRMKTFTRISGSYIIDFEYSKPEEILPSRLVVIFEISNMSIPVKMMNDFMKDPASTPDSLPKEAKVIIEYSDYKVSLKKSP